MQPVNKTDKNARATFFSPDCVIAKFLVKYNWLNYLMSSEHTTDVFRTHQNEFT